MEITVLVEPVLGNGFRAVIGEPLRLETDAPTREEAVGKMRRLIETRLEDGAEMVRLRVGAPEHPMTPFAGMLKNDPLLSPWKSAIKDYRNSREQELDAQ